VNDDVKKPSDEVALFRYGVIGDLVHLPPGAKGLYARLAEKAAIDYRIPGSTRVRVAEERIRDWLKAYRKGGLDALKPRLRADHGQSRALPRELSDHLLAIKDEKPELSVQLVIREAIAGGKVPEGLPLAPSTVHRLLSRAGLMAKKPGEPTSKDHRRFVFEKAGDLWMSDVMHGPSVLVGGKKRKTYLIAFVDDATRVVPYAAFALSENTAAYLPVLKEAVLRRGAARRLFVDNGAAFRSHQLALVCAKLGVTLIHARAYHPEAKGYASYCTSSVGSDASCRPRLRRAPQGLRLVFELDRPLLARRLEEVLALVVVGMGSQQARAAPQLDRVRGDVEALRDLRLFQHAGGAKAIVAASQLVLEANPMDGPRLESLPRA
jgi:putative transposase